MKTIRPKDYPDYYEIVPSRTDKLIEWLSLLRPSRLFRPRYLVVAALLFLSFLQFGAAPPKAAAVSSAAYVLMVLPLGTRHIERVALIAFAVAAIGWMDFLPLRVLERLF